MSGSEPERFTTHRTRRLVIPDHLPGETEYGAFINHMTGCADCGYGQVPCERATEPWQAYKQARLPLRDRGAGHAVRRHRDVVSALRALRSGSVASLARGCRGLVSILSTTRSCAAWMASRSC